MAGLGWIRIFRKVLNRGQNAAGRAVAIEHERKMRSCDPEL